MDGGGGSPPGSSAQNNVLRRTVSPAWQRFQALNTGRLGFTIGTMPNYQVLNGQLTREKKDVFQVASGDLSVRPTGANERGSWSAYLRLKAKTGIERLVGYSCDIDCSLTAEDGSQWTGKAGVGKVFPDAHELELRGSGPISPAR